MKNVAIIGGGIAGPVTALALRKAGMDATVYEAYPTGADGAGGSLALAPNGMAALEIV
ncbi:FAD-dependent oxidoreductase, partial [Microbispora rosea]